ncbi:MAG: hypothetical protein AMJ79_12510, partial [Phycisphaerae bacterium SM23_30]
MKKKNSVVAGLIILSVMLSAGWAAAQTPVQDRDGFRFEISFPTKVRPEAVTGRVYAIISRNGNRELRFQTGFTGVPIWGKNIMALVPDEAAII